jgi:hypothetical protein
MEGDEPSILPMADSTLMKHLRRRWFGSFEEAIRQGIHESLQSHGAQSDGPDDRPPRHDESENAIPRSFSPKDRQYLGLMQKIEAIGIGSDLFLTSPLADGTSPCLGRTTCAKPWRSYLPQTSQRAQPVHRRPPKHHVPMAGRRHHLTSNQVLFHPP